MSRSKIEWLARPGTLPEVWNHVTGCNKVRRGCKHCYAEIMHRRLMGIVPEKYSQPFLKGAVMHPDLLSLPYTWKKPRTVFVNSMSDLFHINVDINFIYLTFETMHHSPHHTFIILTKRPERLQLLKEVYGNLKRNYTAMTAPLPNVWILVSVEDQKSADDAIPYVLNPTVPIAVRGISCEPMVGPVDVSQYLVAEQEHPFFDYGGPLGGRHRLDWVVCGGESGRKADPMHPDWPHKLRDDCSAAGIPFFFKQWGEWKPDRECKTADDYDSAFDGREAQLIDDLGKHDNKLLITRDIPTRWRMIRAGKHNSGRLLDGKEYNEFPKQSIRKTEILN